MSARDDSKCPTCGKDAAYSTSTEHYDINTCKDGHTWKVKK